MSKIIYMLDMTSFGEECFIYEFQPYKCSEQSFSDKQLTSSSRERAIECLKNLAEKQKSTSPVFDIPHLFFRKAKQRIVLSANQYLQKFLPDYLVINREASIIKNDNDYDKLKEFYDKHCKSGFVFKRSGAEGRENKFHVPEEGKDDLGFEQFIKEIEEFQNDNLKKNQDSTSSDFLDRSISIEEFRTCTNDKGDGIYYRVKIEYDLDEKTVSFCEIVNQKLTKKSDHYNSHGKRATNANCSSEVSELIKEVCLNISRSIIDHLHNLIDQNGNNFYYRWGIDPRLIGEIAQHDTIEKVDITSKFLSDLDKNNSIKSWGIQFSNNEYDIKVPFYDNGQKNSICDRDRKREFN